MDMDFSHFPPGADPDNQLHNRDAAPLARENVFGTKDGKPDGDRIYLYQFWIRWDEKNNDYVQFIGRNPERATGDDLNTIYATQLAKRWGYGGLCMTNLFALIGEPWRCEGREDAVGPFNVSNIIGVASQANLIVCCWGDNFERGAGACCVNMLRSYGHKSLYHLGLSHRGGPRHVSQVKKSAVPILWT
jgi:hypothetical protein